jgi:hypothetical protein
MIYKRYLFTSKKQAESKVNAFIVDEVQTVKADFVWLDKFTLTNREQNEQTGEVIEPTFTKSYSLDVVWHDLTESPYGWKSYEVEPNNPKHVIF